MLIVCYYSSSNPTQLLGDEIKMICFLNGHPNEELEDMMTNQCVIIRDLKMFWNSLTSPEERKVSK